MPAFDATRTGDDGLALGRLSMSRLRLSRLARCVLSASVAASAACAAEQTQTVVTVDATADVLSAGRTIEIRVFDDAGRAALDATLGPDGSALAERLPYDVPLSAVDGDFTRTWTVQATALDGTRKVIARGTARGGFVRGRSHARLLLENTCGELGCGSGETCVDGRCVSSCTALSGAPTALPLPGECQPELTPCLRPRARAVDAGNDHACAVLATGALHCWGDGAEGARGAGDSIRPTGARLNEVVSRTDRLTEFIRRTDCGTAERERTCVRWSWSSVAVGAGFTCATLDTSPRCWGSNADRSIGHFGIADAGSPIPLRNEIGAVTVETGVRHGFVIDDLRRVWSWGRNLVGQLGQGYVEPRTHVQSPVGCADRPFFECQSEAFGAPPPAPLGPFRDVCGGEDHSCGLLEDGRLLCWGANDRGQLGNGGEAAARESFVEVARNVSLVGCGPFHVCAVIAGAFACWGANDLGQATAEAGGDAQRPAPVVGLPTDREWTSVALGVRHSCALTSTGEGHCWGDNADGGLGDEAPGPAPRALAGGPWRSLSGGNGFTCGITADEEAWCWGINRGGQLGHDGVEPGPVCFPP